MRDYTNFSVQKEVLMEYLQVMVALEDWHGVADVAMDLRELEAKQGNNYATTSQRQVGSGI